MTPRPFPYRLGIGTDIVNVSRIRSIIEKTQGEPARVDRFLRRFLTPHERSNVTTRFQDSKQIFAWRLDEYSKHLAGRWAAKEAAIKAVSWRRLRFHDVVIRSAAEGYGLEAVILDTTDHPQPGSNPGSHAGASDKSESRLGRSGIELSSNTVPASSPGLDPYTSGPTHPSRSSDHLLGGPTATTTQAGEGAMKTHDPTVASSQDEALKGQVVKISISHDGEYATAVCMAAEDP